MPPKRDTAFAAPARRALEAAGITTLAQHSKRAEPELLELHGLGPYAVKTAKSAMKARGLKFSGG